MAIYSIRDLEKLSGIKAHTIRIWEQRYKIIEPQRTRTNIRYYTDEDLKLLLQVSLLNKNGIKISKIADLTRDQIVDKVSNISDANFEYDTQMDALSISMIEMDENKFTKIINTNIQQKGFEKTMRDVIYPFLERLSVLWLAGSITPVQENFMSCLIRQKIMAAIDREPLAQQPGATKFILYLPEKESQELSLLFMHYLLKSRGHKVIYIGTNISPADLHDAVNIHKPNYIFTILNEPVQNSLQQYLSTITSRIPDTQFLVTGYQVISNHIRLPQNIAILHSLNDTIHFLENLRTGNAETDRRTMH